MLTSWACMSSSFGSSLVPIASPPLHNK
jgi:hypothetical protein